MLKIELRAAPNAAAVVSFCSARYSTRAISFSDVLFVPRFKRCSLRLRGKIQNRARAVARDHSGSDFGPINLPAKPQRYHPSEEVTGPDSLENGEASLTPAETSRTIIEVNSKATLLFSGMVNDEVHENIFWPDLSYVTDEYGNLYFQVKNDEDILKTLTSEEIVVQAIVGLDTTEILSEMEALGQSDSGFSIDGMDEEDTDFDEEDEDVGEDVGDDEDDNYENDWVAIVDDNNEDEENEESLGDWAKLETMKSSHPMSFAKKIAEVASDELEDYMDQPSTGLAIQGFLRPAFIDDQSIIQKNTSGSEYNDVDTDNGSEEDEHVPHINGHKTEEESDHGNAIWTEELEKDENIGSGFAFYKLEMIRIQLVTANGNQTFVAIEDFQRAQPDAIAHSAEKIISHLKAGGEKTIEALKSLCWRYKGIQVDECTLIGVDSMGFDVRVCCATQMQTLRFSFKKRAASEYSAERQLNDLLFPRAQKHQQKKEARPTI